MTHYTFTLVNWDINSIQYPKILPLIQKCHSNVTIHELLLILGSATLSAIIHQIHIHQYPNTLKVLPKKQLSMDSTWQVINYLNHKIFSWMRMFSITRQQTKGPYPDCCMICSYRIQHFMNNSILFVINMIRLRKIFHILSQSSGKLNLNYFN